MAKKREWYEFASQNNLKKTHNFLKCGILKLEKFEGLLKIV